MGKKILLADDSITIQKVIELTFSDEDFDVVTVGNGRLAIEKAQEVRPDVVLCDIIMPEKDGYEVCDFIKKHPALSHVPVLLLTGAFEPFDQERAARVGCDGFLAKPFEPQTLIAKVKELLAAGPVRRPNAPAAVASSPAARPAVAPPPAEAASLVEPAGVSGFEDFYPAPDEAEPSAAPPEFEPVFSTGEFEPVEPLPEVAHLEPAPPARHEPVTQRFAPAPRTSHEPVAASAAPEPDAAFVPEEAFYTGGPAPAGVSEQDHTVAFHPSLMSVAQRPPEPPAVVAPAGVAEEASPDLDEFELTPDEPATTHEAPPAPQPPPLPASIYARGWSAETVELPLEVRAQASVQSAYGIPPPPAFEEAFDSPAAGRAPSSAVDAARGGSHADAEGEASIEELEPELDAPPTLDELASSAAPSVRPDAVEEEFPLEPVGDTLDAAPDEPRSRVPLSAAVDDDVWAGADQLLEVPQGDLPEEDAAPAPEVEPRAYVREPPQSLHPPEAREPAAPARPAPASAPQPARAEEEVSFESVTPPPVLEPEPSDHPSEAAHVGVPVDMVAQIAQRVVGQLSEKVIREIAWEVVPDLAEALIRKEIERIKAELQHIP